MRGIAGLPAGRSPTNHIEVFVGMRNFLIRIGPKSSHDLVEDDYLG